MVIPVTAQFLTSRADTSSRVPPPEVRFSAFNHVVSRFRSPDRSERRSFACRGGMHPGYSAVISVPAGAWNLEAYELLGEVTEHNNPSGVFRLRPLRLLARRIRH